MSRRLVQVQNRRKLLEAALRYGTLGLLGAAGGVAFARRRRLLREGKCINDGVCGGCKDFERCNLPPALSAKEVLTELNDGGK